MKLEKEQNKPQKSRRKEKIAGINKIETDRENQ